VGGLICAALGVACLTWAWRAGVPWFERHVLPTYCATRTAHLHAIVAARVVGVVLGAVLILVVAPRAMRARALPTASIVAAIAASLLVTEITVRWLEARAERGHEAFRLDVPRLVHDPRLGWRYAPGQLFAATDGRRGFTYAIDRDGNRAATVEHAADPSRPSIVMVGESIGFGHRVPWDETVAARLERDLGEQVVNLSVHGYDARQEWLRLREELGRLKDPRLVLFFFVPQQIGRWRMHGTLRTLDLFTDEPYHDDTELERTRAILGLAAAEARAHGAHVLFVVTNTVPGCLEATPWVLDELFVKEHLPFVYVRTDAPVMPRDDHPSAEGLRRLADAIEHAM
jgi:hypothetical protein